MTANPLQPIPSIGAPPTTAGAPAAGFSRFSPVDPLRIARQYAVYLVTALAVGLILGFSLYYYLLSYNARFTSSARILVMAGIPDGYADPDQVMIRQSDELSSFVRNQLPKLTSEEVLSLVLGVEAVRNSAWFKSFGSVREAREALTRSVAASPIPGTALLEVRMSGSYPDSLPVVLDQVVALFVRQVRQDVDERQTEVRRTFVRESEVAQATLRQIDEQTRRFKVENDLHTYQTRVLEDSKGYGEMGRSLSFLEIKISALRAQYDTLVRARDQGTSGASASEMATIQSDPSVREKSEAIRGLNEERVALASRFGPNHNRIRAIDESIRVLRQQRDIDIENRVRERRTVEIEKTRADLDRAVNEAEFLQKRISEIRANIRDLESRMDELRRLQAGADSARQRQVRAETLLEGMRVKSIRPDALRVEVLLSASRALLTYPTIGSVVPAMTLGVLGLVGGLIFLRELLDQRLKSPQDVRLLPNTELLGVLPDAMEDRNAGKGFSLAVRQDPNGLLAESFRQFRTTLLSRMDRRGYKSLLLVGIQGGGGVSEVAGNLAVSLAHNGRRVLLIDANFRRPSLHRIFNVAPAPGLFEVLQGQTAFEDAVAHVEGLTIDVLSSGQGRGAPPEILESAAARALLGDLETQYDLVLIDSPPALISSEAQLLAKQVDAVVTVVRAMSEKRGMIGRMLRQLDGYRADMLGLVLNGVRSSAGGYYRRSYQDFYTYRQSDDAPSPAPAKASDAA